MAAPKNNQNAVGNPGGGAPAGVDRELSKKVRNLALNKIKIILERPVVEMSEKDKELHDAILLKLAGTVLPRLNEHTGEDGADLFAKVILLPERKNETNDNLATEQRTTDDSPASIA